MDVNSTVLPYRRCTEDDFSVSSSETTQGIISNTIYCPETRDYSLLGNYGADKVDYLQIAVVKCIAANSTDTSCSSNVDTIIQNFRIAILVANSYVDFNDYENPVKRYFDDRYSYKLTPGFRKISRMFLRQNTAEFRDSLMDIGFTDNKKFYSVGVEDSDFAIEPSDGTLYDYVMLLDHNKDNYERSVYSLFDLSGQLGGLYEVLELFGKISVGFITSKMLILTMMSNMYHVQKPQSNNEHQQVDVVSTNKNNGKTSIFKIEPKPDGNNFSKLTLKPVEDFSEVGSNFNKSSSNLKIPDNLSIMDNKKRLTLNNFYDRNVSRSHSKRSEIEQESSINLINQLENEIKGRRKLNF